MRKLEIILEKGEDALWGRVEGKNWLPVVFGNTIKEVVAQLKDQVNDYIAHEGIEDKEWNNIDWDRVKIDFKYDLQSFFIAFPFLNLAALATILGINRTLLNNYKSGAKQASLKQAKKIEAAIHELAYSLSKVQLVA